MNTARQGFETDVKLETEKGVEFDYGKYGRFILKRAVHRNVPYAKAMKDILLPHIQKVGDVDDDAESGRLLAKIYADTIVAGIKSSEGISIPYDDVAKQAIAELFIDAPDLFQKLQNDAQTAQHFRKHRQDAEAKN